MSSTRRSRHEKTLVEELQRAVHGVSAPFACGGTLVPKRPVTLRFPDSTEIAVRREKEQSKPEETLRPLLERCGQAGFGEGRKTRYDRSIRDALQIKAAGGGFSVTNFDAPLRTILEEIRRELTPHLAEAPKAELYNLNVYTAGGHFAPHKDTPRGGDMLGTLVVCLPARFSAGEFVLRHLGIIQTYDWANAIDDQAERTRIHWAAFFGDVDHEIQEVRRGVRVTLTYAIRRVPGAAEAEAEAAPVREPLNAVLRQELRAMLEDTKFLVTGGTLAFPCSHLYHQDARFQREAEPLTGTSVSALKGRDYEIAAAAIAEGLEVILYPYMIEDCGCETWQLERFPTKRERAALPSQMDQSGLEKKLSARASSEEDEDFDAIWVDPPPQFEMYRETSGRGRTAKVKSDLPAFEHLHSCEYSPWGYFGNEGSDIDIYIYCALHVRIPMFGKGVRGASAGLRKESRPRRGAKRGG